MPALTLKFEIGEIDPIKGGILSDGIVEVSIEPDGLDPRDIDGSLRANLPEWDAKARKKAAASQVDYDSYSNDSAYLDEIDRRAERFATVSVHVHGAVRRLFDVDGSYPNDGGLFGDTFDGVNESEASFQAAWTMAENDGWSPEESGSASIDNLLAYMEDQRIWSVGPRRVTKDESLAVLTSLLADAREAGIESEAVNKAAAIVESENAAKAYSGEIRYTDESEAAPAP